jgi:hypothetical protein
MIYFWYLFYIGIILIEYSLKKCIKWLFSLVEYIFITLFLYFDEHIYDFDVLNFIAFLLNKYVSTQLISWPVLINKPCLFGCTSNQSGSFALLFWIKWLVPLWHSASPKVFHWWLPEFLKYLQQWFSALAKYNTTAQVNNEKSRCNTLIIFDNRYFDRNKVILCHNFTGFTTHRQMTDFRHDALTTDFRSDFRSIWFRFISLILPMNWEIHHWLIWRRPTLIFLSHVSAHFMKSIWPAGSQLFRTPKDTNNSRTKLLYGIISQRRTLWSKYYNIASNFVSNTPSTKNLKQSYLALKTLHYPNSSVLHITRFCLDNWRNYRWSTCSHKIEGYWACTSRFFGITWSKVLTLVLCITLISWSAVLLPTGTLKASTASHTIHSGTRQILNTINKWIIIALNAHHLFHIISPSISGLILFPVAGLTIILLFLLSFSFIKYFKFLGRLIQTIYFKHYS